MMPCDLRFSHSARNPSQSVGNSHYPRIRHHLGVVEHAGVVIAERHQVAAAVVHGGAVRHRLGHYRVQALRGPHVVDRAEVAGIDHELGARSGPVAEHVRQLAAGGAYQDAGLEVLVADGTVDHLDPRRRIEAAEDLFQSGAAEVAAEVVGDGDFAGAGALHLGGRPREARQQAERAGECGDLRRCRDPCGAGAAGVSGSDRPCIFHRGYPPAAVMVPIWATCQ